MKKIVIPILTLLVACSGNTNPTVEVAATPAATPAVAPTVAVAETTPTAVATVDGASGATATEKTSHFNGILMAPPQSHATITLTMGGIIKETPLLPGDFIKRGALVARLENPEFIELQRNYIDTHAQSEFLHTEFLRQQTLSRAEAASQKRAEQSYAEWLSMCSRKDAAAAQLALLGVDTTTLLHTGIRPLMEVRAPISGYICDMWMNVGRHFNPGEPLCDIINKDNMLLRLTAYEKDLARFRVGEMVEFRVDGIDNTTFTAILISVGQHVDSVNRSIDVYARIKDNNPQFRPGMSISARIKKG